jgi:hypothetical protein
MKKLFAALALFLATGLATIAQQATLKGTVIDTSEKKNLTNSVVALLRRTDSVLVTFSRTDKAGQFTLGKVPPGKFILMVTHPMYADYIDNIEVTDANPVELGNVKMILKSQLLQEVIVSHKLGAIRIKGDTIEYKADSFYVAAGSTVEDLLKKLPGITVDKDGKITAQGESVQKVLVDGEEFFSDDPTIATRGLTADELYKVQVFDKKSDQAAFTGIDDGQKTKTIDLKLKEDRKKGYFGKIELGTDANRFWNNTGMLNAFKGKRKFAAFGIMSNTGKTGLDWNENMNYGGTGGGMDMGVTDDGGMYMSFSGGDEFDGGSYYGEGLPKGWSGGLHYSNKWNGDKTSLNSGYQFNKINAEARGNTFTQNLLQDTILYTNETGKSFSSKNRNRINLTYDFTIDSSSSIKITAQGSTGENKSFNSNYAVTRNNFGDTISIIDRQTETDAENKAFNSTLLYRKKFKKQGRTVSISARQNYTNNKSTGFLFSDNFFYENGQQDSLQSINQQKLNNSTVSTINARVAYTEPINKRSLIEFTYGIDNNHRQANRTTLEQQAPGVPGEKYVNEIDSLSNDYSFNVLTHNGGISYRYAKPKRISLSFGMNVSRAGFYRKDLRSDTTASYSFTNFFPQANMNINLGTTGNIRFNYSGSTQAPSLDQIQPIRDNTDQLNIRLGNTGLKQAFRHNVNMGFNSYKFLSERNMYINANFSATQNDFSSVSYYNTATGQRVTQPVNVNGNYRFNSNMGYNKKIKQLGVRLGFNGRVNYNHNNNFIGTFKAGGVQLSKNTNDSYSFGGGPNISYDKEKVFSVWLQTNFSRNISKSTLRPDVVTKYWTQDHYADITGHLPWKIDINTSANFNLRQKTSAFENNNNAIRWNARIDKKILKNDAGRIRLAVFDILDQNIGFNRNISSNFVTERTYDTIRRYFMLSFIYNFSKNGKPVEW